MRQWVKPRSLLLHLAYLIIATGCGLAADWQIHRAIQGNPLSYLYAVEWPAFIVVAGIGWWQMVHDTPEDIAARRAHHAKMRAASAAVVARTLPRSARAITVGSQDLASRALDPPAGVPPLPAGSSPSVSVASASPVPSLTKPGRSRSAPGSAVPGLPDSGWVPARSDSAEVVPKDRPDLDAVLLEAEETEVDPGDQLAAYNRYLATLALHGKPKTWRNPRGI